MSTSNRTTDKDKILQLLDNLGEISLISNFRKPQVKKTGAFSSLEYDITIVNQGLWEEYNIHSDYIISGTIKSENNQNNINEMYEQKKIKTLTNVREYLSSTDETLFRVTKQLVDKIIDYLLDLGYCCWIVASANKLSNFPNHQELTDKTKSLTHTRKLTLDELSTLGLIELNSDGTVGSLLEELGDPRSEESKTYSLRTENGKNQCVYISSGNKSKITRSI